MRAVVLVGKLVAENMRGIAAAIASIAAYKAAVLFGSIATSVIAMTKAMTAAAKSGVLLNAVLSKSVLGVIAKLAITLGAGALAWEAFGRDAVDAANEIDRAAEDIKKSLSGGDGASGFVAAQADEFQKLQERLIPAVKAQNEYNESVKLLEAAFAAGNVSFMEYNLMLETLQMNLDEVTKGTVALAKAQKEANDAMSAARMENTRIREETQAVMDGARAWEEYKKAREVSSSVEALEKDLQSAGVAADEIKRLTSERQFLLETQQQAIAQYEQEQATIRYLENTASRAFDRIGSAITQMAVEGKDAFADLRNIGRAVVSELMQSFIELAAINPLKNALFGSSSPSLGGIGGFFGSLFGGGGGGSILGLEAIGATVPYAALADGGSFTVGSSFPSINAGRDNRLVTFAARDGERVTVETPGQQRVSSDGGTGGGQTVYMTLNNPTRDMIPELVQRLDNLGYEVKQTRASIPGVAVSAVADAQRRGRASMRSAFG